MTLKFQQLLLNSIRGEYKGFRRVVPHVISSGDGNDGRRSETKAIRVFGAVNLRLEPWDEVLKEKRQDRASRENIKVSRFDCADSRL